MGGFTVVELPSDERGNVDLKALRAACDDTVAGLMLTNPNTLGLFEEHVEEVVDQIHACGGLVYGDGANMNALLGIVRPGDLGIDVMHFNLHKTFSTPHGGGGPGSGPVGVCEKLVDFLPGPIVDVIEAGDGEEAAALRAGHAGQDHRARQVVPRQLRRAGARLHLHPHAGQAGLRAIADHAVLNANYLRAKLRDAYHVPYDRICMHEFVAEGRWADAPDIRALDVAKRLMDFGFHPPTNYFPLIVHEALMIEPTETESMQTLDAFAEAMLKIADEAQSEPGAAARRAARHAGRPAGRGQGRQGPGAVLPSGGVGGAGEALTLAGLQTMNRERPARAAPSASPRPDALA